MGTFYSLSGSVDVQDTPEVNEIVDRISDLAGEIEVAAECNEDDTLRVEFGGCQAMSYESIGELDYTIQELSPYVVEPAYIRYECDGETGELFVGDPAEELGYNSTSALSACKDLIIRLTDDDLKALVHYILDVRANNLGS